MAAGCTTTWRNQMPNIVKILQRLHPSQLMTIKMEYGLPPFEPYPEKTLDRDLIVICAHLLSGKETLTTDTRDRYKKLAKDATENVSEQMVNEAYRSGLLVLLEIAQLGESEEEELARYVARSSQNWFEKETGRKFALR